MYSCSIPLATLIVDAMRQGRISLPVSPSEIDQCGSDPLTVGHSFFWEIEEITSQAPRAMQIRRGRNPSLGHLV
jgi:hypothetical protein